MEQCTQFWSGPLHTQKMLKRHDKTQCAGILAAGGSRPWWQPPQFCAGKHPCVQGKAAELPRLLGRYLMLMLRAPHRVSGKLLPRSQARLCVWRNVTAQMLPAHVEIFSLSAQTYSLSLRRCSCLQADTLSTRTTCLQLPPDYLYGKAFSIFLVNSCSQSEL